MGAFMKDRRWAGQQLASRLVKYRKRHGILVLALPRGGVPVAAEVAHELHAPLDILLVRKLGRAWKRVHRLVYAAAALTFAHWLLVAFDVVPALVHLAVLVALEAYRVTRARLSARAGT